MKIGIVGPVSTESIRDLLKDDIKSLPKGTSGAPFLGTLIKTLINNGHQVSVYTLDGGLPPEELTAITASGHNFKISYCPRRKHSVRFNHKYPGRILDFYYREIKALKLAIANDQPDIVHAHWSYEYALAAMYSKLPYLVTCHDSPVQVLKYMRSHYRFGRLLMALFVFQKAKCLTAVSPYLKSEIAKFTKTAIYVVPNPTPIEPIKNFLDHTTIEAKLSAPKIVMVLNGWGPLKNAKPAFRAFNQFLKSMPNATLHLFGHDFQVGGAAQQWATANNVEQNINFHGFTPNADILAFLDQATLLLHPALEECCPLTLIEAMSFGIPVIGGKSSGGVPWVLDDGRAGLLADVSDPQNIAEKISALLTDKQLYTDLSNKSLQRVQLLFTQSSVASAYEDIYLKTLAQ